MSFETVGENYAEHENNKILHVFLFFGRVENAEAQINLSMNVKVPRTRLEFFLFLTAFLRTAYYACSMKNPQHSGKLKRKTFFLSHVECVSISKMLT